MLWRIHVAMPAKGGHIHVGVVVQGDEEMFIMKHVSEKYGWQAVALGPRKMRIRNQFKMIEPR